MGYRKALYRHLPWASCDLRKRGKVNGQDIIILKIKFFLYLLQSINLMLVSLFDHY